MGLKLRQLRRMEKLELTIHDLCEKESRNPNHYLDILQAVNDGLEIEVIRPTLFLSLAEQLKGFVDYNQWLKKNYPEHAISDEELAVQETKLGKKSFNRLIFYCHEGDVVLTAELTWEYICSYCEPILGASPIRFEADYMQLPGSEPARPEGFYTMKLPSEDRDAVGKKFQGKSLDEVRRKLGNDWGMGPEGLQFVGITHKDYPGMMDGCKFPFICLPALEISRGPGDEFDNVLLIDVIEGKLRLTTHHEDYGDLHYGSGSLQKC